MRRFALLSAGILAVVTMTAGCLPFYQTAYYHPEAASGIAVKGSRCGGPPDKMELAAERVRVSQIAWKTAHGMGIGMTIIVPPEHTVSLLERHVELAIPGSAERYHAPFEAVTLVVNRYPQPKQSIERPMRGDADPRDVLTGAGDRIRGTVYSLSTEVVVPEADVMESRLPRFSVDGRAVELPKIILSRRTYKALFEPINC